MDAFPFQKSKKVFENGHMTFCYGEQSHMTIMSSTKWQVLQALEESDQPFEALISFAKNYSNGP